MKSREILQMLGSEIKNARLTKGLTQVEISEKINITQGHYSKIEKGEVAPTVIILIDLYKTIKFDLVRFLEETMN